jgi:hypothetical protein
MRHTTLPTLALLATLASAPLHAQVHQVPASRGALLYETHCGACHSEQMHWRAKRLAQDWKSLRALVDQWQGNARLAWTAEDIDAVTRHLNDTIYRHPAPQVLGALGERPPR